MGTRVRIQQKNVNSFSLENLLRIKRDPDSLKYVTGIERHILEANSSYLSLKDSLKKWVMQAQHQKALVLPCGEVDTAMRVSVS